MTASRNELLECVVTETGPDPDHAVIWLHGLGADGNDFAPIVPQLRCAQTRAVRFVFPHAPVRPVTVNGGVRMRAWYDILGFEIARDQDSRGIADSLRQVELLIQHEIERGIAPDKLLLAGFSQGGAVALRLALAREQRLAGTVALSCYLLEGAALAEWLTPAGRETPVFMAHGTHDPIVPVALGRDAAQKLAEQRVQVAWSEWPMQHAVCPEEIGTLDRWIDDCYSGNGFSGDSFSGQGSV
ncbi:MAG TPA: alpha/beta fold hydrolase [Wenzhouxiangellaceae bacterium]|nr:alpha/beta fold hydrolase [Wenzhouxiangellaceae bacterium]